MEFFLLAAIFLTSTGFLVHASVALTPPAATAPAHASGAGEGRTTEPQPSHKLPWVSAPLPQQDHEQPVNPRRTNS
jgi:hypothetical protein